jgi:antitoxin component YwqK of YwqJK toxin-antitoxin module
MMEKFNSHNKNMPVITYYQNNSISSRIHYNGDVKHGIYELYYNNNMMRTSVEYINGGQHGLEYHWFPNGSPWATMTYNNGEIIDSNVINEWDFNTDDVKSLL